MARILVTGPSGFVGGHLVPRLLRDGHTLHLAGRGHPSQATSGVQTFSIGDIGSGTNWRDALAGCDSVIHLAGQTASSGPRDDVCDRVNHLGTRRLVEQAAEAGVTTFVFLSSVMALVDNVAPSLVTDRTASSATSAYGLSKLHAEHHVAAFAGGSRRAISLRPPMIYGTGAKGNWKRLEALAASGLPLPLASVANRRSLISVTNVADALARAVAASDGPSGTYIVSDAGVVSIGDIVRLMREGRRKPARLMRFPPALLSTPLRLAGMGSIANSLLGSLEVDGSRFCVDFGWRPVEQTATAIRHSVTATQR